VGDLRSGGHLSGVRRPRSRGRLKTGSANGAGGPGPAAPLHPEVPRGAGVPLHPEVPRGARDPQHIELGIGTGVGSNVPYRLGKLAAQVAVRGSWLDCGCADGAYARALRQLGAERVVGIDVDEPRVERARTLTTDPAVEYRHSPSEALPFTDATFDGVWLNEVLEHVRDEQLTLAEIHRVLRPGGTLALMSPNRWFPFEGHGMRFAGRDVNVPIPFLPWLPGSLTRHVLRARNYWPYELRDLVASAGLEVEGTWTVLPVFEVFPWLPGPVIRWYRRNLGRIERTLVIGRFGVSTLVIARRRGRAGAAADPSA
jgi:SAM-dependent methyltransferase